MTMNDSIREFDYEIRELADIQQKSANTMAQIVQGAAMSGKWATDDSTWLDASQLKALFVTEDWVYITVDLIAMKISNQYIRVMRQTIKDGKPVIEPAEGHPVQKILDKPNEFQDYHAWMYANVVDLALLGNSIQWYRSGSKKIYNIPSEAIHIDFDQNGKITKYRTFETIDKEGMSVPIRQFIFNPNEIIHYKKPNPSSMIWGLSPFLAGQRALLFNRYSTEYLNSFYQKGASPGMVLEMAEMCNENQAIRILKSFEQAYAGRRNQRRTLITPKGVTAKQMSHSLADQQLKDYIQQNRETILALLKIPPHEVGIQKSGSLGSEEYKTALKNFWAATLKPMMKIIAGGLTLGFQNDLENDHFLEFDLTDVDILQEDKRQKADLANAMLTTRTLNEVRNDIWNDPPLAGGDKTPGLIVPAIGFSEEIPPITEEIQTLESKEIPTISNDEIIKQRSEKLDRWIKANNNWFDSRQNKIERNQSKSEPSIYKLALNTFEAQAIAVIKEAKKFLKDEKNYIPASHGFRVDHVGSRKSWCHKAEIKDKKDLEKRVERSLDSFQGPWEKQYTKTLDPTLELGYDVALDVPFDIPNRDEIDALRARNAKNRRQILAARGINTFSKLNETTTERIMKIIEDGAKNNLSVNEIIKNLVNEFTNIPNIQSRAETIARTETLTAVSLGQAAAMKDAAKVIPNLQKMWIATNDDRTRGLKSTDKYDHAGLNGQIVKYNEDFRDSRSGQELPYPRAPGADAGMVINCRCTWIMLPAEEMQQIQAPEITV